MGSIMGSQNIMGLDYGSNISVLKHQRMLKELLFLNKEMQNIAKL
jgi:hypothetical protein